VFFKTVLLCNPERIFFPAVTVLNISRGYEVAHNLDFGFKLRWSSTFSHHLWYLLGRRLGGSESHSFCGG